MAAPGAQLERPTSERLARTLRRQILRGEIPSGSPLREVELARRSGASRPTVREALRLLVHEGLAAHIPHRGVAVARIDSGSVAEIYGARMVLETDGLGFAARLPAAERERLLAIAEDSEDRTGEGPDALYEADLAFHQCIVGFLGQPRISRFHRGLMAELRLALVSADRDDPDAAAQGAQHRRIAELLVAGEKGAAKAELRRHLEAAEKLLGVRA